MSKKNDKIARVLHEFKNGKLKSSSGEPVTDYNQALAIALSEAGVNKSDLKKAEIKNKLRAYKAQIDSMIRKELENEKSLKHEIIRYFKENPNPTSKNDIMQIASRLAVAPDVVENMVYAIMSGLLNGGKSKGEMPNTIDSEQFNLGMQTEAEHTEDEDVRRKIVLDHLAEDPKYYSKLKQVEGSTAK